jgi:pimeloyl-ACP methyl ester carboxylesterase
MPEIKVGDLNMYYEVKGRGSPLLMIVGLSFSLLDWGDELPDELAKHYQVILFDNRDAGRTTGKSTESYTTADMADDTAGLLKALGIPQAHVFGVSMGGMIAQQFALRHASKLNKLVLGCTMAGGVCSFSPSLGAFLGGNLLDLLFTPTYIATNRKELEDFLDKTRLYHSKQNLFIRQMQAIASHNTCDVLQNIKAPTLIITGDSDVAIPPKNSDILAEKISNSKLQIIKDAGHGFPYSHGIDTAEKIIHFLEKV